MKIKKEDFTVLQQEQIDLGIKNGLTDKQIAIYAKKKYDFLQMQEIREALERNVNPLLIRLMYHSWISHMDMEKINTNRKKDEINVYPYFISLAIAWLIVAGFLITSAFYLTNQRNHLLKENHIQLNIGDELNVQEYLEDGLNKEEVTQVNEVPQEKGNHLIIYKQNGNLLYDFLFVEIKDETI